MPRTKKEIRSSQFISNAIDFETIATSYHEAGHIIVGMLNFIKIIDVNIDHAGSDGVATLGVFEPSQFINKKLRNSYIKSLLQALAAGPEAENIFYCDITGANTISKSLAAGGTSDRAKIHNMIGKFKLARSKVGKLKIKTIINSYANSILIKYWNDVKNLSKAIYLQRSMSYDDMKVAIVSTTTNKKFWKTHFKELDAMYQV